MSSKAQTISERLREMANCLDITQADIVRTTGIAKSTLSLYFNGKRIPQTEILVRICDAYGIDPAWIIGKDVPMFRKKSISADAEKQLILDYLIEDVDIKLLIECYTQSDEEHRKELLSYANFLINKNTPSKD